MTARRLGRILGGRGFALAALAILSIIGGTACSPNDAEHDSPSAARKHQPRCVGPTPSVGPSPLSPPTAVSGELRPDLSVTIPSTTHTLQGHSGGTRGVLALGPRGELLVKDTPPPDPENPDALEAGDVSVISNGEIRTFDRLPTEQARQVVAGATDGLTAAWVETPSITIDQNPYVIAYARVDSGPTVMLASELDPRTPDVPGYMSISLARDRIFWTGGTFTADGPEWNVYSQSATGGEVRHEANAGFQARTAGGALYYMVSGSQATTQRFLEIHRCDISTGVDTVVVGPRADLLGYAVAETGLVYLTASPNGTDLILQTKDRVERYSMPPMMPTSLNMSDRFVVFSNSDTGQKWYFDLRDRTFHNLGPAPGLYVIRVGGNTIAWLSAPGEWSVATID